MKRIRKRLAIAFFLMIALTLVTSCGNEVDAADDAGYGQSQTTEITQSNDYTPSAAETEPPENIGLCQAQAFFIVFQELFDTSPGLNREIRYISVDLSETMIESWAELIRLLDEFCTERGFTLLLHNMNELEELGYIDEDDSGFFRYFSYGILITFRDVSQDYDIIEMRGMKWRSPTGAVGGRYTVVHRHGSWEFWEVMDGWIS